MLFYDKYILPKLIDSAMKSERMEKERSNVIAEAVGVVLEIGFGSGLNLPYYRNVTKLYAVEPSQELYDLSQDRIKKVRFPVQHLRVSAEAIPLEDSSVDSIISTWTMCSIPHPDIALREALRILKPGGKFGFIEHGHSPKKLFAKLQSILTPVSKCLAGGCHLNREIEKIILNSGFQIQKLEKFPQKSRPLAFMYKGVAVAKK